LAACRFWLSAHPPFCQLLLLLPFLCKLSRGGGRGAWKAGADSRVGLVGANNRYYFVVFGNKSLQRFLPALLA